MRQYTAVLEHDFIIVVSVPAASHGSSLESLSSVRLVSTSSSSASIVISLVSAVEGAAASLSSTDSAGWSDCPSSFISVLDVSPVFGFVSFSGLNVRGSGRRIT